MIKEKYKNCETNCETEKKKPSLYWIMRVCSWRSGRNSHILYEDLQGLTI